MKYIISKNKSDNADFNTIYDGINASNENDELIIKPGNYYEYLNISKNINLIGDGEDVNILQKKDEKLDNLIFLNETCSFTNINIIANNAVALHIFACYDIFINKCNIKSDSVAVSIIGACKFKINNSSIISNNCSLIYNNFFDDIGCINSCKIKSLNENNILITKNANLNIINSELDSKKKSNIVLREESKIYIENSKLYSSYNNITLRDFALKKNVSSKDTNISFN